jgi:hypothetical protein
LRGQIKQGLSVSWGDWAALVLMIDVVIKAISGYIPRLPESRLIER